MICLFISLFFLFEVGAGFLVGLVTWCFQWAARGGVRVRAACPSLGVGQYACVCAHSRSLCMSYMCHLGISLGCCSGLNSYILCLRLGCHFYNCLGVLLPLFITFDIQNEPHAFIEQ